ncbi:MAG: prolyl oligopeptidase family serine peptidase [bacterium]|nr:prolyl oligopeptidase family serine peptidase [bacterium]
MHLILATLFSLARVLSYPFPNLIVSSHDGTHLAYVLNERGVRSIWFASAPGFTPRELWSASGDDGQEITNLSISDDGKYVVYVRGGDHDANWTEMPWPDPQSLPVEQHMQVLSLATSGGTPVDLGEGDTPAVAPDSKRVAFVHVGDSRVWSVPIDGSKPASQLFFDRGQDGDLAWSPDGSQLAFTSNRGDHSFVAVYCNDATPLRYLDPTTYHDGAPVWSPDGSRIAFVRLPGDGGPPQNPLVNYPLPWQIRVTELATGRTHAAWKSLDTLRDSLPQIAGPQLRWVAGDQLSFISERNNWPHLYVVAARGGAMRELSPGAFTVEDVALAPDRKTLYYTADTGNARGDDDRRHVFSVSVLGGAPVQVTHGTHSQWWPAALATGVAYVDAGPRKPMTIVANGATLDAARIPSDFPTASLIVPKEVTFRSSDGWLIHGQLFAAPHRAGEKSRPGVIFVHGGPPRQMLLTWHYFDYYSYAYATNQYLASRGVDVLSVNYRLGIGYGHDFHFPAHAGPAGAAEYRDVLAGARFLQHVRGVDPSRIGIWGGSYGGYLTAMGLAKNSDIFKAGVDMHGVHDWSMFSEWFGAQPERYQHIDKAAFLKTAWLSSPDAYISSWRSPVLLIQGDNDRNVRFHQMVDLVERLKQAHVPFEQLVLPDEIHGFLRWNSWLRADQAGADFLIRELKP